MSTEYHDCPKCGNSAEIESLLAARHLQQVPASLAHADLILEQARVNLRLGQENVPAYPWMAYEKLYRAAQLALAAVLYGHGLRPAGQGGAVALRDAANALLGPSLRETAQPFEQMRRRLDDIEYPPAGEWGVPVTHDEAVAAAGHAEAIIGMAARLLDEMNPGGRR